MDGDGKYFRVFGAALYYSEKFLLVVSKQKTADTMADNKVRKINTKKKFVADGVFQAERGSLITLCPSKFMEEQAKKGTTMPGGVPGDSAGT